MAKRSNELRKEPFPSHFRRYWQLYLMMLLPVIYFIIFKYVPMFGNILAFRRYRPAMGPYGTEWAKPLFRYFNMFLKDPAFWQAFRNTLVLSLLNLLVNFPIPILFAILLNEVRAVRFKKLVQTVSYMPRFISTVVVIAMLSEMLSPSSGLVNTFLQRHLNMEPIYFMNEPQYFRALYVLTDTWQFTGWTAIIYLAAITGISSDMFEAATIDGANRFQIIRHVNIPGILPTIAITFIMRTGNLLSVGYSKIFLLQNALNLDTSQVISTYVYNIGLIGGQYSYSTAISLFNNLANILVLLLANWIIKKATDTGLF